MPKRYYYKGKLVPLLKAGAPVTAAYINLLAEAIQSDGCSGPALEFYHNGCVLHDLGYRVGIDQYGTILTRAEVDANFRKYMQTHSKFGKFSPMSWYRWAGVRIFGRRDVDKT